ncbi:MAG TPA: M48 family metallopeptidase [Acidobacteriaceae bacterium]|nr:M48 family metallopeptidase [Acidobacteriaceae bacterium]
MPIRKNPLSLLVCAALAFCVACVYGQNPTAPASSTSAASTQDCSGPVLHRRAADGGDVCAPAEPSSEPDATAPDQTSQPETSAPESQDEHAKKDKRDKKEEAKAQQPPNFDPNVDPFKQVQPLPDGMMPGVKKGTIEDVNAVGSRCIGCRGMGNWYSTDWEIRTGAAYAKQIDQSTRFITDPVVTEYINRIGQNIVRNSDCKVPFTIKVVDSDVINAFALPGGYFYVNSGLVLAADEEDELAGVMAHETAHVCAHHAAREMTRANYAQIGMVPLIMMTGYSWTGYGIYEGAQMLIPVTFLAFSREFEAQADYLGIQYMYRAGYDPMGLVSMFEKIENLEKQKPGAVAKIFEDHPQTPDRILASEREIATILPPRDEYLVTTSEFNDVKARLARIENKRRLLQNRTNRPSLRRVSDTSGNSTDQPTLHRRPDDTNSN